MLKALSENEGGGNGKWTKKIPEIQAEATTIKSAS